MSAFDRSDRFQRELPGILTAIASPQVPDYVDDLLAQAAATRQRPRWTFLERWFPMGAIAQRAYFPTVPWRPILVVAVLILLAVAALLVAGSQPAVPAPFGPARNGALAFGNGDISLRDGIDGSSKVVLGGPTDDFAATFTRDGTRLLFLRRTEGIAETASERLQMLAADRDGSNVVEITPPLVAPDWMDFAPDDGSVVLISGDPTIAQYLFIADLRNPGELRPVEVGDPPMSASTPNFLGPAGAEIVFRGRTLAGDASRTGIFAVRPDGSGLRAITPTDGDPDIDYLHPQPSPDGRFVAYTAWDGNASALKIHLVDLRSGDDQILTRIGHSEGWATFSPDSKQVVFRSETPGRNQMKVAPVDGRGPSVDIGPNSPVFGEQFAGGTFSPDGKWVIVTDPSSNETRLVDATTGGEGVLLPWSAADVTSWQRLAP